MNEYKHLFICIVCRFICLYTVILVYGAKYVFLSIQLHNILIDQFFLQYFLTILKFSNFNSLQYIIRLYLKHSFYIKKIKKEIETSKKVIFEFIESLVPTFVIDLKRTGGCKMRRSRPLYLSYFHNTICLLLIGCILIFS